MEGAEVHRAVIVPPSWEGDRNDLALEAARLHPDRFAVMGRITIESPESRGLMAAWILQEGIETPAQLNKFRVAGYRYDKAASTDTKPVFRRAEGAA